MFTGIVQAQCRVVDIDDVDGIRVLSVDLVDVADGLELGASVANNGACLTASEINATVVRFEVIQETLELTNLGNLVTDDMVNIERSLKFGDEVGGHIVSGHISAAAIIDEILIERANRTVWFTVGAEIMPFILWKGWVALDGVSLTVSRLDRDAHRFGVSLIPETLSRTTLGNWAIGDQVNLEPDSQTQTIIETVRGLLADPDLQAQLFGTAR